MVENQTIYHFGPQLGKLENLRSLCGAGDKNLGKLEQFLSVRLILRGQAITIQSADKEKRRLAYLFFSRLEAEEEAWFAKKNLPLPSGQNHSSSSYERLGDQVHWHRIHETQEKENASEMLNSVPSGYPTESKKRAVEEGVGEWKFSRAEKSSPNSNRILKRQDTESFPIIFTTEQGRAITALSQGQQAYVESLIHSTVTFGLGPAGTGKTYLSIAVACNLLMAKKRDRLILTRPAVEAGESLGFLPGDLQQKIDPYLRPLSDALSECLGFANFQRMSESGQIEVLPLAYMRGRTLGNAVVILDEAQNCTANQLKMFLTRLGYRASFYINGDITQMDIENKKSGLEKTACQLASLPQVSLHHLTMQDIIRHPLVKKIIDALGAK